MRRTPLAVAGVLWLAATLVVVAPGHVARAATGELLTNRSFESTGSGWLAPWYFSARTGAAGSIAQSTSAVDGTHSAAVTVTAASAGSPWLVQLSQARIPLAAGQAVTVSVSLRASAGRSVQVVLQGTASPWTSYASWTPWVGTSWGRVAFTYTPAASVADVSLRFNLAGATGTVWIDAASVVGGTSGSTPTPTGTPAPTATPAPASSAPPATAWNGKGVALQTGNERWSTTSGVVDSEFADLVRAGAGWARIHVNYTSSPDWRIDQEIASAKAHGVRLVVTLGKPWPTKDLGTDADRATYRWWVGQMVARYRYWVRDWEILNEPNLHYEWNIDEYTSDAWAYEQSVKRYLTVLQDAYTTIKAADSGAIVHFAGLSEWTAERYLDVVARTDAYRYFDVMDVHPYGSDPWRVVSRFDAMEARLRTRSEYAAKPIWVTEVGFNTSWSNKAGYVTSEWTKADYLTRVFPALRSAGASGPIFWYTLHENDWSTGYGLELKDRWTLKVQELAAFAAFRNASP